MRKIESEVKEYLSYCEKIRGMSGATLGMKRNVLGRFLREVKIESIRDFTNIEFDRWVAREIKRGIKPQTMNIYNSIVVAMVRHYKDAGVLMGVNLSLVKRLKGGPTKRKFYDDFEIARVCEGVDLETRLMIMIMYETGMRIAELVRLKTSDICGRRINFVGKGGKMREVYLGSDTSDELRLFLQEREGYVWGAASLNGEPPTVATVRKRLQDGFLMAGFEGFYPHALRHSFATSLQKKGASVMEIKEMMGHSSVATTERYLHGFEGRLEELFDKYR